jgi:fumarate reductase flavoprotein subunit
MTETSSNGTRSPDVLVIGAGQAGLCAALSAAQQGATVTILEKRSLPGGSTALSSGLSAYAGTDEQAEAGVADSVELLKKDILETGKHKNDEALVDAYCREQLTTYRWLKSLGVRYGEPHAASGQTVPRSHGTDPSVMIDTLARRAREAGVTLVTQARATQLLTENGKVTGVQVERHGSLTDVRAGAVVLASGGFSRNPELLERFAPQMAKALPGGSPGAEGDGLLMAWAIGADFKDTPYIKGTFGIYSEPDPRESGTGILAVYKGAIAVNSDGRRFANESLPYKEIGDACLAQPGALGYQIFDQRVMDADDPSVEIYWFSGRLATGLLLKADTLEELAEQIGVAARELVRTVAAYNAAARGEHPDEQSRTTLTGGYGTPFPLDHPPYYAHPSTTVVLATYCGLTITPETNVVNVFGEVIDGLYAAGELTGGLHGAGYVTGTSVGKAGIFGRLAGLAAASYARG